MMFYEFHFNQQNAGEESLNLSIWLFSDTGYFISEDRASEKTDVTTFAPAEKSGTKVGFLLYRDWNQEYRQLRDNPEYLRRFLEYEGEIPSLLRNGGVLGKACDFSRLSGDRSTDTVIDELIQLARSGGLLLDRVRKPA
jgi:hypothetical protein